MRADIVLYLLNSSLLLAHEIDSAYWREWELFRVPGGIQVFVLVNLALIAVVQYGFWQVVAGRRAGVWFSLLLALAGIFAIVVHGALLAAGHPQFRLPVSLLVLGAAGIVSLAQGAMAVRALRRR